MSVKYVVFVENLKAGEITLSVASFFCDTISEASALTKMFRASSLKAYYDDIGAIFREEFLCTDITE